MSFPPLCFFASDFHRIDHLFPCNDSEFLSLMPLAMPDHTASSITQALIDRLPATECEVEDQSGGCGAAFEISRIVSSAFSAKTSLARHRLVNAALKEELASIHALSIKQCLTPEEDAAKKDNKAPSS